MNLDIIEGNWQQLKGNVRQQWGKLTDDHIESIQGKRIHLMGKIQELYGITRDEAEAQITAFEERHKSQPTTKLS